MRAPWHRVPLLLVVFVAAGIAPSLSTAAPTGVLPPSLLYVVPTRGDTIQARSVEPQPFDMLRVTTVAGEYFYLPSSRLRRVVDESGADLTREVVERRRIAGQPPDRAFVARPRPPSFSSPYGPRSVTGSVGITETSAWGRLGGPAALERSYNIVFDVGHLFNVGTRTAAGGTLFFGVGEGSGEVGVRARFRYWLRGESSVDFSPGMILSHDEPGPSTGEGLGWVGQVAWNQSRFLGLGAQVYSVRRTSERRVAWFDSPPYTVEGGRDTGFMVGLKLGGKPGLLAAGVAALVGLTRVRSPEIYAPTSPIQ